MKLARPGASPKELTKLGRSILLKRTELGISQGELFNHVSKEIGIKLSQSYFARLEKGQIADPYPEVLQSISRRLQIPRMELLAHLIEDKYVVDESILFPFFREPRAFDDIAEWERRKDHMELWICVSKFVDNHRRGFKHAVFEILKRGGTVTFFLPNGVLEDFDSYRRGMLSRLSEELNREVDKLCLLPVPLERRQVAFLLGSYTIANPTQGLEADQNDKAPAGYLALTDDYGKFIVGFKMSEMEVLSRIDALRDIREKHIEQLRRSPGALDNVVAMNRGEL